METAQVALEVIKERHWSNGGGMRRNYGGTA